MKKLALLGLSGLLGISVASTALAQSNSHIVVRPGDGMVYNIPESEQPRQLNNLAKIADTEDGWLCIEDKCYDIGSGEKESDMSLYIDPVAERAEEDNPNKVEVKLRHIHPKKSQGYDVPSFKDLKVHAQIKRLLEEQDIKLKSEVYDGKGVWTFDVNENLESTFHEADDSRRVDPVEQAHLMYREILENHFEDPEKYSQEQIDEFIKDVEMLGIKVSYKPIVSVNNGAGSTYTLNPLDAQRQFHELAKYADVEDSYLQAGDQILDVGYDEEVDGVKASLDSANEFLKSGHKNFRLIHPHPKKSIKKGKMHPPSQSDILTYSKMKGVFEEKGLNLEADVYDGFGFWTLKTTPELDESLKKKYHSPLGVIRPGVVELAKRIFKLEKEVLDAEISKEDKRKKYAEGLNDLGIILKYAPIIERGAPEGTVYELPWEEAQKQFTYLANTAPGEDAWICDEAEGKCYDIGRSEKVDEVVIKMDDAVELLKNDGKSGKDLKFVHIHPKVAMEENKLYPPSPDDILTLARLGKMTEDELGSKLDAEVYDGKRIWSFDLTDNLKKKLSYKISRYRRGKQHTSYPHKLIVAMGIQTLKVETANNLKIPTVKERADKYVEGIKEYGVTLSYEDLQ